VDIEELPFDQKFPAKAVDPAQANRHEIPRADQLHSGNTARMLWHPTMV
jgi:hypothetical protein